MAAALALMASARVFGAEPAALSLRAPEPARTASTLLLLWDQPPGQGAPDYRVWQEGHEIARVRGGHFLVRGLAPGRAYHFAVAAAGSPKAAGERIEVRTRAAGPLVDVRSRGAQGDGHHDDTLAVQGAINACPPGGTVVVPAGDYRVGHLELKSDLTLQLNAGATLRFLGRGAARYPHPTMELPGPDGPVAVAFGALLTGVRTDNVSIIGEGTLTGNGAAWWPQGGEDRPKLLEIVQARNLLVQGITLEDPPMWNTHPLYVDGAVFADVTFQKRSTAKGTNGDGLDPDSCRDVLIVGCRFGNQDDSIAIKSGKLTPTQSRRQRSCENIAIRDCRFDGGLAPGSHPLGIAIGSENCGGVRHVEVRNCVFRDTASLINIKANRDRRLAVVEDVQVEDCRYANTVFGDEPWNRAPIAIDLFYYARAGEDPDLPADPAGAPAFRNLHFRRIEITNPPGRAVYLSGLPERPLADVSFTDLTAAARTGLQARNVAGLTLDRVRIAAQEGPAFIRGRNVMVRGGVDSRAAAVP